MRAPSALQSVDPEVFDLLERDRDRHSRTLNLIASENYTSQAVLQTLASHLNVKYAEGYPRARYYQGVELVDDIEQLAIDRAKQLFKAEHANVQPYSGSPANMAVYFALLKPGDTVLGMELSQGGHLTHGSPVSFSGQFYNFVHYGVDPESEVIDYDKVQQLAEQHKPKLIVAGASAYSRIIDWKKFRQIADSINARFMADMAHIAGLVAAGVHPSPVPYADVVTTTTHKSLRGPRGALILSKAEIAKEIDRTVFPGIQGGPHLAAVAAKAVCFHEAMQPSFRTYQQQVVDNARALADGLIRGGMKLVSGGTDNHLLVVKLLDREYSGKTLARALEATGIITSMSTVPGERRKPAVTSGVRFGTPAITTRGATEAQMQRVAQIVSTVAENPADEIALTRLRGEVEAIARELTPV
ncbi:MAG: serine hydroxymethyltransferase [Chloroflexi bacterium]|nr:serine hydroxymethyltransferase [Chloroflexota bacterium]MBV9133475.1 serine hydroxymethyltransferase [Chloroflexota bacterium]MBV9895268.1 serine hydroxymethyltransferase [Chloroflexota bacterium]